MITILDGYTDEPSCLGVPPYIAPLPRYLYGAIKSAGSDATYITIDEYRRGSTKIGRLEKSRMLIIIAGALVPGKYIRAAPISINETRKIAGGFRGHAVLGGAAAKFGFGGTGGRKARSSEESGLGDIFDHICGNDLDACIFNYLESGDYSERHRTINEWNEWAVKGAEVVTQHPDYPQPLIAEVETYRGCVRYFTGGCSFCIEPSFGEPVFREPEDIALEARALHERGIVNFRLGAQSCFFSYKATGIGETETPTPNAGEIEKLLAGVRSAAPGVEVLHLDNANPAVIAEHPEESTDIIKLICRYCTSGNAVAFGLESADPKVKAENNLNATPQQAMLAIEMINRYGSQRGSNGMPLFLPGLNFVCGLPGESRDTYELNFQFLKNVLERGFLVRRINIRQALELRSCLTMPDTRHTGPSKYKTQKHHRIFAKFKRKTREEIDREMLKKLVPAGTVLRRVFIEGEYQGVTFGRQVGTYPLLVGIPYPVESCRFIDVAVTEFGYRSITGIEYPFPVNMASLKALQSLPGIGKKRAARLKLKRPIRDEKELTIALGDEAAAAAILPLVKF